MRLIYMRLIVIFTLGFTLVVHAAHNFTIDVKTATYLQQEVYQKYNAIGRASAIKRKDFFANQSGVIDFISDKQGQRVSAGHMILTIEKDLAESIIAQARKYYDEALISLKRNQNLYDKKVISVEAFEKIKLQAVSAKLDLEKSKKDYQGMVFVAPFDGTIGVIDHQQGDYLSANPANPELLFSIIDETGPKMINVYLPESLIHKITPGAKVVINYNNKSINGKISAKASYLSKKNAGFLVNIILTESNDILDGAIVNCEFIFDIHVAKTLPEQAVYKNNSGNVIFMVRENKAKELVVKTGVRQDGIIEVISDDLKQDSLVVVEGIAKLYDGATVKMVD
jgi:RND family efflux transporter MFP subunit